MAVKAALVQKYSGNFDICIFPGKYEDIPGVQIYGDIDAVREYACGQLQAYRGRPVDLYINGGMAVELHAALQAAAELGISLTVWHINMETGVYQAQSVIWKPDTAEKLQEGKVFALCRGRHAMPTEETVYTFTEIPAERYFDFKWQEACALQALTPWSGTEVRIYLTGLKSLQISVLNAAYRLGIRVVWLHWDHDIEDYVEQRM